MDLSIYPNRSYLKFVLLTALLSLLAMGLSSPSEAKVWSERKFEKTILKIDKDLNRKRWKTVIKRSQKALPQCVALYSERALTCIFILRNINQSYEKMHVFIGFDNTSLSSSRLST